MEIHRQDLELIIGLQDWILDGPTDNSVCTGKKFDANWLFAIEYLDKVLLERLHDRLLDINHEVEYKFGITRDLYKKVMCVIDKERIKIIELENIEYILKEKELERPLENLSVADLIALENKFKDSSNYECRKICSDANKELKKRLKSLGYE